MFSFWILLPLLIFLTKSSFNHQKTVLLLLNSFSVVFSVDFYDEQTAELLKEEDNSYPLLIFQKKLNQKSQSI